MDEIKRADEKMSPEIKKIQEDFHAEIDETVTTEKKPNGEDPVSNATKSRWDDEDFISDSVMGFVLGLKNSAIISILAKELGKTEKEMLRDLYEVTEQELKLYKKILQEFIRENLREYMDKIAKITNGDLAAITILEVGRIHEARVLIKAAQDKNKSDKGDK